jgi:hypothetical protein
MTGGRLIVQAAAAFCQHGRAVILVAPRHGVFKLILRSEPSRIYGNIAVIQ